MTEPEWVEMIAHRLRGATFGSEGTLEVSTGLKLAYGYEIASYSATPIAQASKFETDLAVIETFPNGKWKPRVVVEAKVGSVTTHDAITYSQKACAHKSVHPYLRYGIMLGNRRNYPLPGRLYRHGMQFDFMVSFTGFEPAAEEMGEFVHLVEAEGEASRTLEKIIYESRRPNRDRYTVLHRKLEVR